MKAFEQYLHFSDKVHFWRFYRAETAYSWTKSFELYHKPFKYVDTNNEIIQYRFSFKNFVIRYELMPSGETTTINVISFEVLNYLEISNIVQQSFNLSLSTLHFQCEVRGFYCLNDLFYSTRLNLQNLQIGHMNVLYSFLKDESKDFCLQVTVKRSFTKGTKLFMRKLLKLFNDFFSIDVNVW